MLGERRTFRVCIEYLAKVHPEVMKKNLGIIAEYGRWDDMLSLLNTSLKKPIVNLLASQLVTDMISDYPSLCAKWMPSCNTSSRSTRAMAKILITEFGITEREYRKNLSGLRKKINIVESLISSNKWTEVEYSKIPSRAMMIYRNAFERHDPIGFSNYLASLEKGETKINSSTLYPYDILERMMLKDRWGTNPFRLNNRLVNDPILEAQWKALPNYVEGENNILIMADTSGSMDGRPMATSVGLAIYFAERNKGVFANKFMTFSSKPSFVTLTGDTLYEKIKCVPSIVANTDLEKAFDLILNTANNNNMVSEDMPKSLIIITDMQFDEASQDGGRMTFFEAMVQKYNNHGYEMPNIVFWDVDSKRDAYQVSSQYKGVQLVSGQSVSTFKNVIANIGMTPYEAMIKTLNSERYDKIVI